MESPVSPEEWAKLAIPDTMQKLEAYLNASKPTSENQGKPLHEHKLLKIEEEVTMSGASNFKETFNFQNAKKALQNTSLYEASGSLFWLDYLLPFGFLPQT